MRIKVAVLTGAALLAASCSGQSDAGAGDKPAGVGTSSARAQTSEDDKIVVRYSHGEELTYKQLANRAQMMPDLVGCEEALKAGKDGGDTYPSGDALYLRACKEGKSRQQ